MIDLVIRYLLDILFCQITTIITVSLGCRPFHWEIFCKRNFIFFFLMKRNLTPSLHGLSADGLLFFTLIIMAYLADETLCGDPEQPLSSRFNRTSSHEVEYSCVKGYKMETGNPKRTCQANGIWSGMPPRCTGKSN